MEYKKGDEVYVKARVVDTDTFSDLGYKCKVQFADSVNDEWDWVSDKTVSSKTYAQGLAEGRKEGWELVKKLEALPLDEREEILGYRTLEAIIADLTAEYVADRMEAYENKIKVGDVIRDAENTTEIWVTEINGSTFGGIKLTPTDELGKFGGIYSLMSLQGYVKTGKHIDIESILKQIGE